MRSPLLPAFALLCIARSAAAQSRQEPQLIFSITGGLAAGSGALWQLPRQPVRVEGVTPGDLDTLSLSRFLRPGLTATLIASLFRSPHLGYTFEVGYFGIGSEQRCDSVSAYKADAEHKNEQACIRAQGLNIPTSAVGFQIGLAYRPSPQANIAPYLRAGAGPAFLGNSFVLTQGLIQAPSCGTSDNVCYLAFISEQSTREISWLITLSAGITVGAQTSTRFRFEVRDLIGELPVPTGPANPSTTVAPVGMRLRHVPTFVAGFDIVLERRRPRRY